MLSPRALLSRSFLRLRRVSLFHWALATALGGALVWAYWPLLVEITERWSMPEYSHGYFVPLTAVVLLWFRRGFLSTDGSRKGSWLGLMVLSAGLAGYLAGGYYYFLSLSAVSLLFCLAGWCLLQGGWSAFRWACPAVAFLLFMIPLPQQLETQLSGPLQRLATRTSTYVLQTLGYPAFSEGNLIRINEVTLGIVQACNGLSMMFVLLAFAVGVAFVVQRPWWEKIVIAISAIPIALIANVIRITSTGIVHEAAGRDVAEWVFHDVAGWLMMPLALMLLWLEYQFLKRIFVEVERSRPLPLDVPQPRREAPPAEGERRLSKAGVGEMSGLVRSEGI